jgi:RNA polymerase sigma-70 factor (ECF subfamily)
MQSTTELVELARLGDRDAIEQLVERFQHSAIVAAWSVTGDFHLAQDVAQESLVDAIGKLEHLRRSGSFGPWLLTSVRRKANRLRAKRPEETHGMVMSEIVPDPQHAAEGKCWKSRFEDILPLLWQLPEQELDVVNLRFISGMTVKQIADDTGRPLGTVTKQLSRAIQRLKTMFAEVES